MNLKTENQIKKASPVRRYAPYILFALVIASLIPIFVISQYNHSSADDYAYGISVHNAIKNGTPWFQSLINLVSGYYTKWQGIYSAIALMGITPGIFSESAYFLVPLIILAMMLLSSFKLCHTVFCRIMGNRTGIALAASSVIVFFQVQFMPAIREGLFWWNAAIYYTFFFGFMLLYIDRLAALYISKTRRETVLAVAPAIVLAAVIGGGNYITSLLTLELGGLFFILCAVKNRKKLVWSAVLEVLLLAAFLVCATAPGNSVRQDSLNQMGVFQTVLNSVIYAFGDCVESMNIPILVGAIMAVPFLVRLVKKMNFEFKWPAAVIIIAFLLYASQNAPSFFAQSWSGPGRVRNMVFFGYIWMILVCEFYVVGWAVKRLEFTVPQKAGRVIVPVLAVILAVTLFYPAGIDYTNSGKCLRDLKSGCAEAYSAEMEARFEILNDETVKDAVLQPIENQPETLFGDDIAEDTENWINIAVSSYFDKNSVRLAEK